MKQSECLKGFSMLSEYQKNTITREIKNLININLRSSNQCIEICPKCHNKSIFIKKGIHNKKQRIQCKSCNKKFTIDSGKITMYSHYGIDIWMKIAEDTLNFVPLCDTASNTDLCISTVFHYRHKILCLMSALLSEKSSKCSGTIEADEIYILESKKGSKNMDRPSRKRGGSSQYRWLSREQLCIITASDRNGHEVFHCDR